MWCHDNGLLFISRLWPFLGSFLSCLVLCIHWHYWKWRHSSDFKYIQLENYNNTISEKNSSHCSHRENIVYNITHFQDTMKQLHILNRYPERFITLHVCIRQYIPVSQLVPVYPAAHLHVYMFTPSRHVPPCWQGPLLHIRMTTIPHTCFNNYSCTYQSPRILATLFSCELNNDHPIISTQKEWTSGIAYHSWSYFNIDLRFGSSWKQKLVTNMA